VAKYRQKTDDELRWNRIRRRLTRELDIQIGDWREEALDKLLTGAFTQYVDALETGKKLELEGNYTSWVAEALSSELRELMAGPSAQVE
jgi:hypothetical protein